MPCILRWTRGVLRGAALDRSGCHKRGDREKMGRRVHGVKCQVQVVGKQMEVTRSSHSHFLFTLAQEFTVLSSVSVDVLFI